MAPAAENPEVTVVAERAEPVGSARFVGFSSLPFKGSRIWSIY